MALTPPPGCTFFEPDWRILSRQWFAIAIAADIGDGPVACMLLDEPLVLYRVDGAVVIARDICPHRGVPLSLGRNDGSGIVCAYHGLRFGAAARCIHIPSAPDLRIPDRLHARAYPAAERYGLIWTCLDPPEGAPAIPPMPHWDDAGFQQIVCPQFDVGGFAGRQVEGFLDVAHFAWVHSATFASPENVAVPSYMPALTEHGFTADYRSNVPNYPIGAPNMGPPDFVWLRHFELHLPFTATLTVHFPDDGRLAIMNAASPVSARKTRLFVPIARNFGLDQPVAQVHDFNRQVFEEDRRMVEAQVPECLPLDATLEAHIPADRCSIAYRRGLRGMGFSQFFAA